MGTTACDICKKKVAASTLPNHMRNCQRKLDNDYLMCDKCNYKTVLASHLKEHIAHRHNGEKRYKCDQCEKTFYKQYHLDNHRSMHSKTADFICEECGCALMTRDRLLCHIRKKHRPSPKIFECVVCLQHFKCLTHIYRHLFLHTEMTPYECSACQMRFRNNEKCRLHTKSGHPDGTKVLFKPGPEYEDMKKNMVKIIKKDFDESERPFKRFR